MQETKARRRRKPRSDRRLIVFDLDHTLICRIDEEILVRPHATELLLALSEIKGLDVGIWTAASEAQAERAVQVLTEAVPNFAPAFVKDQRNCQLKYDAANGEYHAIKDLAKTKRMGWSLHSTIIVEDTPQNCVRNRGNAIYVRSWHGREDDRELQDLRRFLFQKCADPLLSVRSLPLQDRWRHATAEPGSASHDHT
jgi:hypothetical protein